MDQPILAAGFAVFTVDDDAVYVLLLRSTCDRSWDFPKGLSEAGEITFVTAIRELREETGLCPDAIRDELFAPEALEYTIPPGRKKHVTVFPLLLNSKLSLRTIQLSSEHDQYCWVKGGDLGALLRGKPETNACLSRIMARICLQHSGRQEMASRGARLKNCLPGILRKLDHGHVECSWYLHGSYAGGESTLPPYGFSDVDLLCASASAVYGARASSIGSRVQNELRLALDDANLSCGIYYFRFGDKLVREPQWTYFSAANCPLLNTSSRKYEVELLKEAFVPDPEHELPRAIWYRLLKYGSPDTNEVEYSFVKGIIASSIIRNHLARGHEFRGYLDLKRILQSMLLAKESADPDFALLSALDHKLNFFHPNQLSSRKAVFVAGGRAWLNEKHYLLSPITRDFCNIALDMLDERRGIPQRSTVERLTRYMGLRLATAGTIWTQLENGDHRRLLVLMTILRVWDKGSSFRSAFPKYAALLKQLTSEIVKGGSNMRGGDDLVDLALVYARRMSLTYVNPR